MTNNKVQQSHLLLVLHVVLVVATEIVKVKLNSFDDIGETEAYQKLNELKQEPTEEKSTVPQVFKKVLQRYFLFIYPPSGKIH